MAAVAALSLPSPPPPRAPRTLAYPALRVAQASSSTPSPTGPKALIEIEKSRVIACLRAEDGLLAMEAARAALRGGVSVLEVAATTPGVLEVVKGLVREYPSSTIGVGTVLDARDAREAVHAGAKFLMSPCTIMEILRDVQDGDVLYIPGVMTPTEVLCATNAGARIVKIQ